jgi:hypothetical protein
MLAGSAPSAWRPSNRNNGHEQKLRSQTSKNQTNERSEVPALAGGIFLFDGDRANSSRDQWSHQEAIGQRRCHDSIAGASFVHGAVVTGPGPLIARALRCRSCRS